VTVSQNGWPANRRDLVSARYVPGASVRLVVRNGPAGDLLLEVAALFDLLVVSIENVADDWGYAERPVRGSTAISNHASGTAIDLNATCWTLGRPASVYLDAKQIGLVRAIVAAAGGVVRWGGDYQGRKDPMHFEINDNRTEADCVQALAALRTHFGTTPAATRPIAVVAPASPLPPEEDDVDLRITPDEHGMFHTATQAEVGAGTQTGYLAGYVTLGSYWGGTDFIVTALGVDGPLWQWADGRDSTGRPVPIRVASNRQWSAQLPDGTRGVTVEGTVLDLTAQTVPTAAVWHVR
jgi:hypothetical protein